MKKLKYTFVLICLSFITNFAMAGKQKYSWIRNDSISFSIVKTSLQIIDSNNIEPSKYLIIPKISEERKEEIKKISKKKWKKLLMDEDTNWAANVLLYYINKKDALYYYSFNISRNSWIDNVKAEDLNFWFSWCED